MPKDQTMSSGNRFLECLGCGAESVSDTFHMLPDYIKNVFTNLYGIRRIDKFTDWRKYSWADQHSKRKPKVK